MTTPLLSETPRRSARPESSVRDLAVVIPDDFRLVSGERLAAVHIRARLIGPAAGPLVVVGGGISAGRCPDVTDAGSPGWWAWAVGAAAVVDTSRLRVLALDWLPGGDQDEIVTVTPTDQARLLALVLDALDAPVVDAFVGASYGGCVGMAFAQAYPERIERLVVISAAHRAHPAATAWRGVQRRILSLGLASGRADEAVALARELAMTTYRTAEEFDLRFGSGEAPVQAGGDYAVCDYLTDRGRAYVGATSPQRWITLSDSLDRHRVVPEQIHCALTLVGFTTDRLVPIEDIRALAQRVPSLERLVEATSIFGHDAFLKEREVVCDVLETALAPLFVARPQEIAA
ncbi:homoserine O-succinyltransferase [Brevundimonas vitis]|uniref:Homoserine O-succinyltransferase n=1 Tax=Brevundimonas vitisensis TaxID=2800818 RepID=A0ABX7BNL3_9CAUL|nr:homoserine O-succinyltransferase [Brevundimonas vitisensis]